MSLIERLMEGCVYRPKHGYEDSGEMSQVDEDKTDELIFDATNRILKLEKALQRIRNCKWDGCCADRMDAVAAIAREALE